MNRREFLKSISILTALSLFPSAKAVSGKPEKEIRRIWISSDIHIGKEDEGYDGAEWLKNALGDVEKNLQPVDYAVILGDIVHDGRRNELEQYISIKKNSRIKKWFELAGNHEHYGNRINIYRELLRSEKPYFYVDGNVVWLFISDELHSRPGNITEESTQWIVEKLEKLRGNVIIVCSHQMVKGTIEESEKAALNIHPDERIRRIRNAAKIDLWLSGHLHHSRPRDKRDFAKVGDTSFLNAASLSHAYDTGISESFLIELEDGTNEIVLKCRNHDKGVFNKDMSFKARTGKEIRLDGKPYLIEMEKEKKALSK